MKLHNVHARDLAASPEQVGALIDGLGGDRDRLWPAERWPTTPFELDGPLVTGTSGRQGFIHQHVEEYTPGRRLVFRFAPGLGLDGMHRLELEPLGADRTRLVHTLDCRVAPKLLPVYPILVRQHDALVEDLFDCAELATTGRVAEPARWPASVRISNGLELRLSRLLGKIAGPERRGARSDRVAGVAVPAALTAIAALHAAWALGWRWPGGDDRAWAERVIGSGEPPPDAASWAVAVALLAAAATVRSVAAGARARPLRIATWALAGLFLARGALFIPADLIRGLDKPYERLDLTIYSPLCLALGAGTAAVARAG
jgi:Protein of unknown function (DUF3995)